MQQRIKHRDSDDEGHQGDRGKERPWNGLPLGEREGRKVAVQRTGRAIQQFIQIVRWKLPKAVGSSCPRLFNANGTQPQHTEVRYEVLTNLASGTKQLRQVLV